MDEDNNVLALVVVVVDGDDERDDDVGVVDVYCCGILDDGIELSLTDGVVTDKAGGIWKSLAECTATILIGACKDKRRFLGDQYLVEKKRILKLTTC